MKNILRDPDEHPASTFREFFKVVTPILALIAACIACYYSYQQFENARRTSERQLRAYVMFDGPWFFDLEAKKRPGFHFGMKNYGPTPAFDVRLSAVATVDAYPRGDVEVRMNFTDGAGSTSTLGPSQDVQTRTIIDHDLTAAEMRQINSGQKALYLDAEIRYQDTFGFFRRTRVHRFIGGSSGTNDIDLEQHTSSVSTQGDVFE